MTVKELKNLVNNIPEECDDQILFACREDALSYYPYYVIEDIDYASNSVLYRNPDYDPNQHYFYLHIC